MVKMINSAMLSVMLNMPVCSCPSYPCVAHGDRFSKVSVQRIDGTCATPGTIHEQWTFAYDGDDTRVKQIHLAGTTTTTTLYFFGGAYETVVETSAVKKYYGFAGQTLAMDDGTALQYFLSDHLGSMSAVLDDTGTLLSEQRYMPRVLRRGIWPGAHRLEHHIANRLWLHRAAREQLH